MQYGSYGLTHWYMDNFAQSEKNLVSEKQIHLLTNIMNHEKELKENADTKRTMEEIDVSVQT